jgi:hypothetical protein
MFLPTMMAIFPVQVAYLDSIEYQRYFVIKPQILLLVNIILLFSFLSKGIYQLGAYFLAAWMVLPDIPLQVFSQQVTFAFGCYLVVMSGPFGCFCTNSIDD